MNLAIQPECIVANDGISQYTNQLIDLHCLQPMEDDALDFAVEWQLQSEVVAKRIEARTENSARQSQNSARGVCSRCIVTISVVPVW